MAARTNAEQTWPTVATIVNFRRRSARNAEVVQQIQRATGTRSPGAEEGQHGADLLVQLMQFLRLSQTGGAELRPTLQ